MSRSSTFDRKPPQNIEAERSVLGAMLLNPDAIPIALEALGESPDAFYVDAHGIIYGAIIDLYRDGDPVDMVTLHAALLERGKLEKAGGVAYLGGLTDAVPTSANAAYYAGLVRAQYVKRALITTCTKAAGELYNADANTAEVLAELESGIFAVARGRKRGKTKALHELVAGAREAITDLIDGGELPGIKTGFKGLDGILRPMTKANYIVLAARPSIGKTTLACNVALNACAKSMAPVLVLSLEMSKEELASKMLGIVSGLRMRDIERGKVNFLDKRNLARGAEMLANYPIHIDDDASLTALELRGKVRAAVKDHGAKLVIIDYLQLMRAPGAENRTNEIAVISREIKAAAKEGGVPIIALSQLNREGAAGRPQLTNIRDGGAVEQDADIVVFLSKDADHPPEQDGGGAIIADVQKQRNGATGECRLWFDKPTQRFRDFGYEDEPPVQKPYRDDDGRDEPFDEFVEDHYQEPETAELF